MSDTRLVAFLPVTLAQGRAILGAMRAVAEGGGGLRAADEAALAGAAAHVLNLAPDAAADPAEPGFPDLAALLPTPGLRRYAAELIAVMAFVDGRIDKAKIDVALAYVGAMGVSDDYVRDLAAAATGHIAWLGVDMNRNNVESIAGLDVHADMKVQFLPYDAAPDDALAGRFRALEGLAHETFGRAFFDHYRQNGYPFPGEGGGLTLFFAVPHDSAHLLSGYSTSFQGELLVSTFTAAMHRSEGMSGHILPVIFTWHLGLKLSPVAPAHRGAFDGEKFWRAWERGRSATIDTFGPDWDFWSLAEAPLQGVREAYRLPVLEAALAADGLPLPVRPWGS